MRFSLLLSFATCLNFLTADQFNSALLYKNGSVKKLGIACDGPSDIAIFGDLGYICNRWGGYISVIDLNTNSLIKKIKSTLITEPYNITVNQTFAFVTKSNDQGLFAINLAQNLVYDYSAKFPNVIFSSAKPLILGNFLFVLARNNDKAAVCKIDISDIANPILVKTLNFPIQNDLLFTAQNQTFSLDKTQLFFGGFGLDELTQKQAALIGITDLDLNFSNYIANFSIDSWAVTGGLVAISNTKLYGCSRQQDSEKFPIKNSYPIVKVDLLNQTISPIKVSQTSSSATSKTRSFQSIFSGLYALGGSSLNQEASVFSSPSFYSGYSIVYNSKKNLAYVANMGPKNISYGISSICKGELLNWRPTKEGGGGQGENVLIIDGASDTITNSIQGFNAPQAMALTSDGSLYVCDGSAGSFFCGSTGTSFSLKKLK